MRFKAKMRPRPNGWCDDLTGFYGKRTYRKWWSRELRRVMREME